MSTEKAQPKCTLKQVKKNYTLLIDMSALPLSPLEEVHQAAGSRSEPTTSMSRPLTAALGHAPSPNGRCLAYLV